MRRFLPLTGRSPLHSLEAIHFALCVTFASTLVAGCGTTGTESTRRAAAHSPHTTPVNAQAESSAAEKASAAQEPKLLSREELADGWISLFDGETLFGWKAHSKADWHVADGAIVVTEGEKGLLCTTFELADYVLRLEFRSAAGTNSGIFLRTPGVPTDPKSDCYELNIADSDNPFPTGSLVGRAKAEGNFDSRDWQSYEVTVLGNRVTVVLDGKKVLEYTDPSPLARGHIGLQLNSGKVEFRNIRLKPLGLEPMLAPTDLTQWKVEPDSPAEFTIDDEAVLRVKGGPGQLETRESYGDFVMQLECITHAEGINSGIFFRCIPGDKMMGYESQIHNGFLDGDRMKPVDAGSGAIFRRQAARLVVADDLEWFTKTIIADRAHMAVWVDGYQVTDWTDERPDDENPRRGKRLAPGTIMIQAHDPGTNLSFRKMRIAEIPGE
jgi:hypothetical protein